MRQWQSVISAPQVDRLFSEHVAVTCSLQIPKPATFIVKGHNYSYLRYVNNDQLNDDDVIELVKKCAKRYCCALDPMSPLLVAECIDVLLSVININR